MAPRKNDSPADNKPPCKETTSPQSLTIRTKSGSHNLTLPGKMGNSPSNTAPQSPLMESTAHLTEDKAQGKASSSKGVAPEAKVMKSTTRLKEGKPQNKASSSKGVPPKAKVRRNFARVWTDKQTSTLFEKRKSRSSYAEIAKILGRTELACRIRYCKVSQMYRRGLIPWPVISERGTKIPPAEGNDCYRPIVPKEPKDEMEVDGGEAAANTLLYLANSRGVF